MNFTATQIILYISFIVCIILISYYYKNNIETFASNEDLTNKELTMEELNIQNILENKGITNITIKNKIMSNVKELQTLLEKTKYMDAPISINNNGKVCDDWSMYNDNKYSKYDNSCIQINNSQERKCLSNSILTSCSNYYDDGKIDKLNIINTNEIKESFLYNNIVSAKELQFKLSKYNTNIDTILNDLITKRNLENQQKYFIDYNNQNLDDKKILFDKTNTEFEKSENNINIKKVNFQDFLEKKHIIANQKDTYYYYIKWLIIILLIVGFFNFMFSNIL